MEQIADYKLHDGVIDIWLCQSTPLQNQLEALFSLLSEEEKSRARRFKFDVHRNQFIAFHGFMRLVLAKYLKIDASKVSYKKGDKGKPYIDKPGNQSLLQFNLSHTGEVAVLAVTQGAEIGIDIEHMQRNTDWQGVGRRFFTVTEQAALFSLPTDSQQQQAFFELWTRKEAYMKVLGSGLSLAPTEFTLSVPPKAPSLIQHHSKKYRPADTIEFRTVQLPEQLQDYCATLATACVVDQCRVYEFS